MSNLVTEDWTIEDKRALRVMVDNGSMVESMLDEFGLSNAELKRAIDETRNIEPPAPPRKPLVGKRTSAGLRDKLFDAMDGLISGAITPDEAKAVSGVADAICKTVRLEMDAEKMRKDGFLRDLDGPAPLQLGRDAD